MFCFCGATVVKVSTNLDQFKKPLRFNLLERDEIYDLFQI